MDLSAKHVGFVLSAYAVAFTLLAVLIGAIVMRMRLVRRRLAALEAEGAVRRAAPARPAVAGAEMSGDVNMASAEQGQEAS